MEKSKLVRDKIPQIIKNNGDKSVFHIASDEEYGSKLNEKLIEEVNEWSSSQTIGEMADIFEVITAILENNKRSIEKVADVQNDKRNEKGSFKNKIILDSTE